MSSDAGAGAGAGAGAAEAAAPVAKSRCIGIDFGSLKSVVAYVDRDAPCVANIANNELSKISTPSVVAFNGSTRSVGQEAMDQRRMNVNNTITDMVRLTGSNEEQFRAAGVPMFATTTGDIGRLCVDVEWQGGRQQFCTEHVASMLLRRLASFATNELDNDAETAVAVAVPPCYSAQQRKAVSDAAKLAGLESVTVVDAVSSMAAAYLVKHADRLPAPTEPSHVMFLSVGHAYTSCGVVAASTAGAHVKSCVSSDRLGGSNMDMAILDHCKEHLSSAHNVELETASKQGLRVLAACEKGKKVLSTIDVAQLDLVNVAPELDVQVRITREEFETRCAGMATEFKALIAKALADASIEASALHSIELLGGGTRVPFVKAAIEETLPEVALAYTLDSSAGVAQGAALLCERRRAAAADMFAAAMAKAAQQVGVVGADETGEGGGADSSAADASTAGAEGEAEAGTGEAGATEGEAADGSGDAGAGAGAGAGAAVDPEAALAAEELRLKFVVGDFMPSDALTVPSMSDAEVAAAREVEAAILEAEAKQRLFGEARNALESYVLRMQSLMYESDLIDADAVSPLLLDAEDYLYGEGRTTEDFQEKLRTLQAQINELCPAYFADVEAKRKKVEAELLVQAKIAAEERAKEEYEGNADDHDRRKLKKADRLRLMSKNKEEGNELFGDGNYKKAAVRYVKAITHGTKFFDLSEEDKAEVDAVRLGCHLNLSMCYLKLENWHKAFEAARDALEIDPKNVKALFRQATARWAQKDVDGTEAAVKAALAIDPENKSVLKMAKRVAAVRKREKAQRKKMAQRMFS